MPKKTLPAHLDVARRHDFVLLFDVHDGNPNGDPDAGNLPRIDPETMQGLVTDVAIKRKIRNYISAARPDDEAYKIYVESGTALNANHERAYKAIKATKSKAPNRDAQAWMCANFFDVRLFGAVMSTGDWNCGQVKGPVQLTFARSLDPVVQADHTITRVTVTDKKELEDLQAGKGGKEREMGRKATVPYALYRAHGYYSPHFATQTGVTTEDLELLWEALIMMWDLDRSAARGDMACRGLYVFSHDNPLGNAPSHTLLDRITIEHRAGIDVARSIDDYKITATASGLPKGVTYVELPS